MIKKLLALTASVFLLSSAAPSTAIAGVIGDLAWNDLNRNGIQEISEPGLGGVGVSLWSGGPSGTEVAFATTSSTGFFQFSNLGEGDYALKFTPPSGYFLTVPNVGADPTIDSDANQFTGFTNNFFLAALETNNTIDAGMFTDQAAPEPGTLALLGLGLAGVAASRRRKQ